MLLLQAEFDRTIAFLRIDDIINEYFMIGDGTMKQMETINNIYQLDGKVPLLKAIPFGLQHILAMFVANLTPITIIAAAGGLSQAEIAILLQNAMFVAGIATLIQLYPLWKVGSKLPIVMGVSFTFVTILSTVAVNHGYPAVIGAVICGGIFEEAHRRTV